MENLKKLIKDLAEEQKNLKEQRKTVNFKGIRTLQPFEACYKHLKNRHKLRILYAAYGIMRGKSFSQIENSHVEENHPLKEFIYEINNIIDTYSKK